MHICIYVGICMYVCMYLCLQHPFYEALTDNEPKEDFHVSEVDQQQQLYK